MNDDLHAPCVLSHRLNEVCISDPCNVLSNTHSLVVALMRLLPLIPVLASPFSLGPKAAATVGCRVVTDLYRSPGHLALWKCLQDCPCPAPVNQAAGIRPVPVFVIPTAPSVTQQLDCCRIAAMISQLARDLANTESETPGALLQEAGSEGSAMVEDASGNVASLIALSEKGLALVSNTPFATRCHHFHLKPSC